MKKIAFFGTPEFAATALSKLLEGATGGGYEVSLVFCQPDRRSGRGQKFLPPPVKILAEAHGIPVYQPASLLKKAEDGQQAYQKFVNAEVDLGIVVAYGKMIPKRWLHVPKHDLINIHGSLLPRWRGAAPIQRAIEAGDKETGVCLMEVGPGMDEGAVFAAAKTKIETDDTSGSLFDRLSHLGADLLMTNLDALLCGSIEPTPQNETGITHAAMISKEEAKIDWNKSAVQISQHVRAMTPNPGAYAFWGGERVKLMEPLCHPKNAQHSPQPGFILSTSPLQVQTGDAPIEFGSIQFPGKKAGPWPQSILLKNKSFA